MGTAAKYNVYIEFRSTEDCNAFLNLFGEPPININETLANYYGEKCHFDIRVTDRGDNYVELEIFSERNQNTDWQQEILIKFIKEKASTIVYVYSSHGWFAMEGEYIDFDDYNIDQQAETRPLGSV